MSETEITSPPEQKELFKLDDLVEPLENTSEALTESAMQPPTAVEDGGGADETTPEPERIVISELVFSKDDCYMILAEGEKVALSSEEWLEHLNRTFTPVVS